MAPITTEIQRLREEIEAHNYAYYVLSAPTISDYDFDQLLKQLEREAVLVWDQRGVTVHDWAKLKDA